MNKYNETSLAYGINPQNDKGSDAGFGNDVIVLPPPLSRISLPTALPMKKHDLMCSPKVVSQIICEDTNIIFPSELVTLEITDNGIGFSVPQLPGDLVREGKLGLAGILERTHLLNGTLEIESEPGSGTTIRAKFTQNGGNGNAFRH